MTKEPYLVVYDYGSGGVWAVIYANRGEQIFEKYPMLRVFDKRPSWMNEEEYQKIRATHSFDIDDEPHDWLLSVFAGK